jgi:16S rRNA processing protein RimM
MIDIVSVGKLVATFGVKGEMILAHGLGKKTDLNGVSAIMLEDKSGSKLPYFLLAAKAKSEEETIVQMEGVNSKELATELLQKHVWLQRKDFDKHASSHAPISLIGYTIVDEGKLLGEIEEIIEQPHQLLCTIYIGEKEVLIPLHEESLLKIDRRKKQVHVNLPEGLLDIYLG